jgi:hypothetical protein
METVIGAPGPPICLIRCHETEQGITGKLREFVMKNHNAQRPQGVAD